MPSGEGFLAMMIGYLINSRTGCNLFNWVRRHVLRSEQICSFMPVVRNVAVTTFMELNTVYGRAISSCCLSMTMLPWGDRYPGPTSLLSVLCSVPFIFLLV